MTTTCVRTHEEFVTQELGDELVVFDRRTTRYHTLSRTSALVFRLCDGTRTPEQLAVLLMSDVGGPAAADVVDLALAQLEAAGLVRLDGSDKGAGPRLDRRTAMRRLATAGLAAAMLPTIATIAAPLPTSTESPGGCVDGGDSDSESSSDHSDDSDDDSDSDSFLGFSTDKTC